MWTRTQTKQSLYFLLSRFEVRHNARGMENEPKTKLSSVLRYGLALTKQGPQQQRLRQWGFKRSPTQPSWVLSNSVFLTNEQLALLIFAALRHYDPEAPAFVLNPLSRPPPQFIFKRKVLITGSLGYSWHNQIFPGSQSFKIDRKDNELSQELSIPFYRDDC